MKNKHEILNRQANIAQLILDKLKECGYPHPNSIRSPLDKELVGEKDEVLPTELDEDFILLWDSPSYVAGIVIEEDGNISVASLAPVSDVSSETEGIIWEREYTNTDDFFKEFDDFGEQLRKGEQ